MATAATRKRGSSCIVNQGCEWLCHYSCPTHSDQRGIHNCRVRCPADSAGGTDRLMDQLPRNIDALGGEWSRHVPIACRGKAVSSSDNSICAAVNSRRIPHYLGISSTRLRKHSRQS